MIYFSDKNLKLFLYKVQKKTFVNMIKKKNYFVELLSYF